MRALGVVALALVVAAAGLEAQAPRTRPARSSRAKRAPAPTVALQASAAPARGELAVRVHSRALKPGEVLDVTVTTPVPLTTIAATLGERPFPLWRLTPTSWRGLVGLDVDQEPGTVALVVGGSPASGPPLSRTLPIVVAPGTFAERRLNVPPKFVDPPESERPRIEREAAQLHALYDRASIDRIPGPFVPPVRHRRSSSFGSRSIFNGQPRERHAGLDFASPKDAVIRSPAAGTVALVGPLYFTGNTVVIDHGRGLYSVLAHMSEASVREGQVIEQGAVVGRVGATGRVTAPHLHWSVRLGGARVDPASLLEVVPAAPAAADGR